MAYRVNLQFKDGAAKDVLMDIIAAAPPSCGETIRVSRHGRDVSARVTAVWTHLSRLRGRQTGGLIMVEACEI